MGVPLLDVSQTHAGPEARKSFLRDLVQSFQDYGFVRLTNHSVPATRVKQMFDLVRRQLMIRGGGRPIVY